ncbi:FadR/GntR family transcriptional regulator [Texcoconibacillus texcoconensis]|uniref:GntR family transcriptional repressor for pyruvate dehydrogenase complex n=1 Tax=Texcoconibacillus texcoconensis TaxID=1095777 RepID=A0A840QNH7_9BACI|nr:FadR/GntR family transcriptional regulator [Texcoconibacillus texcoconensis]MBB5172936.1 GntR family transcriptional repressor for pyruvate dehydrogenase complex [Texcoconibacillus texcoconensis]
MMKQVRPKKIYEIVAEQLTEMIKNGEYKAGDRLASVQQLAEEFDVGRSAIREALSAMRAMGLIEIRQGEGTFVKRIDTNVSADMIPSVMQKEDIRQLFEIRKLNETGAAALAAERRDSDDVNALRRILEEMKCAEGDGEVGERSDIEFHLAIVKATKNDMLDRLMTTISETMQESMREARQLFLYSNQTKMDQLYDEHLAIFQAIENKDPQLAYEQMMRHITEVEKALFLHSE